MNGLVWNHYYFQFGYRAEGFEDLLELVKDKAAPYAYQTTSTTTPSSIFSELRSLSDVASKYYRAAVSKPKLTVYAKIMGEQVAVAHYDQNSLLSLISQGMLLNIAQLSHIVIESVVWFSIQWRDLSHKECVHLHIGVCINFQIG